MEAKASVADLVKRLHSNIDSIHQTIQSLSDTTSHDAELDRLTQERETKVRDLRKEHEDAVKALRIQREKEAQELAESRRKEEEELEKRRQREYEEMMARRAREDAERKQRFEEQQRELDRAKEEEERKKNREQEMQEKKVQDTIEAELEKLEDEMERKVEEGKKALRELDENRKAINAQIEEALYAPSMIPNLNFRSRAKTTGQSSINNGKGWWETSKERSYTVSITEKLTSQPKSTLVELGESTRALLTNEIKEKEDPIKEDTSTAENNGIDPAHLAETDSQTHPTKSGRSEPQNYVHAQTYTAQLKADHPNDQEPEPRSLSQLSVHQTTASEDQLGIDQPISDILQIHSTLSDSHKLPDEKIEDLKTESAEAQNKTFPERTAIIEQKAELPNVSESVHDAKTYPVENAEEEEDAGIKDIEVGNPIVERDIEQSAEVDVRGSKTLAPELPDSTSPRSHTNVANGITLETDIQGSSSGKETRKIAVSLTENKSVKERSSSVAQYNETEQLDIPTSIDTNRSEAYDPHELTQEDEKSLTSSGQHPSSTEDPVPAYSESSHFNDFIAQQELPMKSNSPALSEQTRKIPSPAKGNEVHQLGLMSIQLSPKIPQPSTEDSSSPSEQRNLEMDFSSRGKQPEELIKPEEIPLPTPTQDAEKNLQLDSALVPADTVQRLEQDFIIQDQLSLQELDSKTADLANGHDNDASREHLKESSEADLERLEMVQDHDAVRNPLMSSLNNPEEGPIAHAVEEELPEETIGHHQSQQPISEQSQPLLKEHEQQSKCGFDASTSSASLVVDSETPSHEPAEMIRVEQSRSSGMPRMQYHRKINRDLAAMHGYNSRASRDESDIQDDAASKVVLRPAISEKEVSVLDAQNINIEAPADIESSELAASSPVKYNGPGEDTSLNKHGIDETTLNNFSVPSIDQADTYSNSPEDESPSDGLPHNYDVQLSQVLDGGDLSTADHGLGVDTSERNFIESTSSPLSGGMKSGRTTPEKPILKTDPSYQKDESTPTKRVQFKDLDPLDTSTKGVYLPADFDVMGRGRCSSQPEGGNSDVLKPQSEIASSKTHKFNTENYSHTPTKEAHASPIVSEDKVQPQTLVYDHQEVSNQLSEHHNVESPVTGANSDDLFKSDEEEEEEEEEDQRTPQPNENGLFPLNTNPALHIPSQEVSQQGYSADSPVQSSPIQSRWAQLRKNAAERAAASKTAEQTPKDELEIKAPIEGDFNGYNSKETIRSPNPKSETSTSDETEDFHSLSDYPQLSRSQSEETTQFYESYDRQPELNGQRSRSATTDTVPSYVHSDDHSTPSSPSEAPSSPFQEVPGNEPAISSSWQSPGRSLDLPEEPRDVKTQVLPISGDFDPFNPQSYPSYATKKATDIAVKSQDVQEIIPSTETSNQAQPVPLSRLVTETSTHAAQENSSPVLTTRDSPRSATPTNIESPTRIPRRSVNNRRASTASPINPATTSFFQKTRQLFESPGATAHQISHARTSSPRPLSSLFYSSSASSSPSTKSQSGFYNAKPPVSPYDESRDGEEPELIPRSLDRDGRAPSPVYTLPAPPPPPKDNDLRRNSQSPRGSFLGGLGRWAGSGGLEESVYNPNRKMPEGQPLLQSGGVRLSGGVRFDRERRGSGYEGEGYGDGNRN